MATSPRLEAAYTARVKAIRARVEAFATAQFTAGQYRDADLERFVGLVVPVVLAGQRQVSAVTDAYLARQLSDLLGRRVPPVGALKAYPRGVDPVDVYARPFVTVRTKLSEGMAFDGAKSAGLARLVDITRTDMQLAKTHTAREAFSNADGITGYSRVLSGNVSCALCYVASTQRYSREDLLPIHPGCDCSVEPIMGEFDRDAELSATHEAISDRLGTSDAGARAPDYRKQLIVQEHGEMGPMLAVRGQHFSGKSVMDAA